MLNLICRSPNIPISSFRLFFTVGCSNIFSATTTSNVWGSASVVSCPSVVGNDWYMVTLVNICSGEGGCSSMVLGVGATRSTKFQFYKPNVQNVLRAKKTMLIFMIIPGYLSLFLHTINILWPLIRTASIRDDTTYIFMEAAQCSI